jgi:hypothetical protein
MLAFGGVIRNWNCIHECWHLDVEELETNTRYRATFAPSSLRPHLSSPSRTHPSSVRADVAPPCPLPPPSLTSRAPLLHQARCCSCHGRPPLCPWPPHPPSSLVPSTTTSLFPCVVGSSMPLSFSTPARQLLRQAESCSCHGCSPPCPSPFLAPAPLLSSACEARPTH